MLASLISILCNHWCHAREYVAQQLNCFGLSVDVKKMTKELVNSRLCKENCQVTVVLTKAENNRGNYTSTQNTAYFLMILLSITVFKEGDESRYTNPLTSYDLLTKSAVKTSLWIILKHTKSKIWAQKMNSQSTEINRSSNLLKSHSESKIQAKLISKSASLLASAPSSNIKLSVYNLSLYTSKMRNPLLWAAVIRDHGSHISGRWPSRLWRLQKEKKITTLLNLWPFQ